jgi:hypothetical protein
MFEHIDGKAIATTAYMMRAAHSGTVIIVEGGADKSIYSKFIDCDKCIFVVSHGKKNALDAIDILNKRNFEKVVVIVDADFWHLDGIKPSHKNIFLTDTHDLETMILRTEIFKNIIYELVDNSKAKKIGKPVDELLVENSLIIGYFKWINSSLRDDLCLSFKDLSYERFIDATNFRINLNKLIYEVKTNSDNLAVNNEEIKNKILELMKLEYDVWQVCSGHDLTKILAIGLNSIFGFESDGKLTPEGIEKLLRIAYGSSNFSMTFLYRELIKWVPLTSCLKA